MNESGVLVGSDLCSEWLLPWWWEHYSKHNGFPVAFADFGMSEHGIDWCLQRGAVFSVEAECPIRQKQELPQKTAALWELCCGEGVWNVREAWIKKAYALLNSPFPKTLWIDIDCQIHAPLKELFSLLDTYEIGIVEDTSEQHKIHLADEPHYNSGVIIYRRDTPFFSQFRSVIENYESELPGDEELLGRAIYLHSPKLIELPAIYNWRYDDGTNPLTVITHYSGGPGKLKIMETLPSSYYQGVGIPKKKL